MTTLVQTTTPVAPTLTDLTSSEWLKLRSLRSTFWTTGATVVVSLGMSLLATWLFTSRWDQLSPENRHAMRVDPIGLILQPGMQWGQLAVCVLAVLAIASEYSTGSIRSSLLAVPTRTPLLVAKAVVLAASMFVLGEVIAFGSFAIGAPILSRHVSVSLTDPDVVRAIFGAGLFLAVTAMLALGVATLVRNTAAGITAMIVLVLVVPVATSLLPGRVGEDLSTYLPGGAAGQSIVSSGRGDLVVGPWPGLLVAVGWAALALVLAAFSLRHRDV